ncbi:MAG TPA: tRNA glutamyl-Q(34) synthetase GluQRS [Ghiorsea sp.]|nr:tRNA glutamyl-Q(34) synthetase GluQRS [Ghiorsea sp.]HIP07749.1 tRNA glutamyl-Q(34) synthetase GluQRS [Mariprofundaceae bacterium]
MLKTRFAPSPSGLLHLGNIYSALQCEAWAKSNKAQMILRIEDVDFHRCKTEFSQQIMDDLAWLGIHFDGEPSFQQQRLDLYQEALDKLIAMDVLYPCFCSRKEIQSVATANPILDNYPRTCLALPPNEVLNLKKKKPFSWRLDTQKVAQLMGWKEAWIDANDRLQSFDVADVGDVIIGRKDIQYSYHLSVVVDDAQQGISHVIRGEDLRSSTPVHRLLQLLLGYESPVYIHHALLVDEQGARLAKSKYSTPLQLLRQQGLSADDVLERISKVSL